MSFAEVARWLQDELRLYWEEYGRMLDSQNLIGKS